MTGYGVGTLWVKIYSIDYQFIEYPIKTTLAFNLALGAFDLKTIV